jgi:hypothetical protein
MANYLATDTDLTAVANAIRTKGGTSAQLQFPAGFVSAVEAIPTGGGGDETWYAGNGELYKSHMEIPSSVTNPRYLRDGFKNAVNLVSYIQQYGTPTNDSNFGLFYACTNLETVWVARPTFSRCFYNCAKLKTVTLGRIGLAVTSFDATSNWNSVPWVTTIESVTCYVDATTMADVPSAVKNNILPTHSPNAVVSFLNYQTGALVGTLSNS